MAKRGTGGLADVQHGPEELDLGAPVAVEVHAHGAALGEVRVAAFVAQVHAGAGVPVPDVVVSEQAGDVAPHLVGVEGTVVGEEEVTVAAVGAEGLPGKDAQVGEQGDGGEVGRILDLRDAAGARVDIGGDRVLARVDE